MDTYGSSYGGGGGPITKDVVEAESAVSKFQGYATTVEGVISEIQSLVMNEMPGWQGAAKEGFLVQFEAIKPHLQQFVNLCSAQGTQIQNHTNAVVDVDNRSRQQFVSY